MLCNSLNQAPQACKQDSSKRIQQQQQQQEQQQLFQQYVHGTSLCAAPLIATGRKQSCTSTKQGSHTARLGKVPGSVSWLAVVLVLTLAAPMHAQPQGTCPVSINYAASLGQGGGDNSNVPIFVGSVGITNNANVSTALGQTPWGKGPTASCALLQLLQSSCHVHCAHSSKAVCTTAQVCGV